MRFRATRRAANYNLGVSRTTRPEPCQSRKSLDSQRRNDIRTLLSRHEELARARQRAAVGEMAAGLAHELRNPLAGMQMALVNLRREITVPDQAERLDLVLGELKRVSHLLTGQLEQARPTPQPLAQVQLSGAVSEVLALVRHQVPDCVRLEQEIRVGVCDLPEVQFRQVLLDLVLNAVQAIGDDPGEIHVRVEAQGERLELTVEDDGPGFPPEILRSGARPPTAGRDGGPGFGLAGARRFAFQWDGELQLSNRIPRGACAVLTLSCLAHG